MRNANPTWHVRHQSESYHIFVNYDKILTLKKDRAKPGSRTMSKQDLVDSWVLKVRGRTKLGIKH
jgi:hypothetical protein